MDNKNFSVDDGSEHEHDQLPSVEDVKTFISERKNAPAEVDDKDMKNDNDEDMSLLYGDAWVNQDAPPGSTKRACNIITGLACLLFAMILTIVLCVVLIEPLEKPLPNKITYAPTMPPTRPTRLNEVNAFLMLNFNDSSSSLSSNLTAPQSPQQRAAVWIADLDERNIPMQPNATLFIQRYALAVFYYAVDGEDTFPANIGFLSREHECNWNRQEFYEPKNMTRTIGATCNENMEIDGLYFPHNMIQGSFPAELNELKNLASVQVYY